jgi:cyclophilin family peptidyl-prolyl cis-trans isomerase
MKKLMILAMLISVPTAFAQEKPKVNPGIYAHFETSMGNFAAELFEKDAPMTVANFIGLADGTKDWKDPRTGATMKGKHYYDNLVFHRVIENFMIQGGDPLGDGSGGPGYNIKDEFKLKHSPEGTLAMANTGRPNSAGSQFYITVAPFQSGDGSYTVFGQVVNGMDVVKAISHVKTGDRDKPLTPVVIRKVTIERVK